MENNYFCSYKSRKGISYIFILFFAFLVTVISFGLAFNLSGIRPPKVVNALTLISSDYQVETYVTLYLHKAHNSADKNEIKPVEKEILPGIQMLANSKKIASNEYLFDILCNGEGLYRKLKIVGSTTNPSKFTYLE